MQVVIDTNIIISAFLSGQGSCRLFMDQVFAGQHEVIVSETPTLIIKSQEDTKLYDIA